LSDEVRSRESGQLGCSHKSQERQRSGRGAMNRGDGFGRRVVDRLSYEASFLRGKLVRLWDLGHWSSLSSPFVDLDQVGAI